MGLEHPGQRSPECAPADAEELLDAEALDEVRWAAQEAGYTPESCESVVALVAALRQTDWAGEEFAAASVPYENSGRAFDLALREFEERPGYSRTLFELLARRCELGRGAQVLEIGPGVGQATLPMLEMGAQVTAVEMGPGVAARLRERTEGRSVEVVVSPFEDAKLSEAAYDLVVSATAFHWINPASGLPRCATALRDGGWLALWWTIWGDPAQPDPFREALEPFLRDEAPQLVSAVAVPWTYALNTHARVAEIEAVSAFGRVERDIVSWESQHSPGELRQLYATFSPWIELPETMRERLLDEVERVARDDFGGLVRRTYHTILYSAQRTAR